MKEDTIQHLVRELVSSEIRETAPSSSVQLDSSNNSARSPDNVVATFQNVNEEFSSRFNFPRSRSTAATFPANSHASRENASSFNPAANYGGRVSQRRSRRHRISPYAGESRQSFTCTNKSTTSQLFNKDVFLLPCPSLKIVPRGSQKAEIQRLEYYVDALCFFKEMSLIQVKQKLTQVLEKQLVDSEGKAVRQI